MKSIVKPVIFASLTALLCAGGGAYVVAQAPDFSLPPLPGAPSALPALPAPASADAAPALPAPANATTPATPAAAAPSSATATKDLSATTSKTTDAKPAEDKAATSETTASASGTPVNEAKTENKPAENKSNASAGAPLPNEAIDQTPTTATPPVALSEISAPLPQLSPDTALPSLPAPQGAASTAAAPQKTTQTPDTAAKVTPPKPEVKSWMTHLAPAIIPPTLGYHYRRELLPGSIYRRQYDADNRHLPTAVTTDDYARLFLMSVARNDVNAARALLNAGVPVNISNANGETALALAQRYGAADTARLLLARGAQPTISLSPTGGEAR